MCMFLICIIHYKCHTTNMFQVCYEEIEVQNKCLIVALCISLLGGKSLLRENTL